MTAKAEGLWEPTGSVCREEIRHMQSRVDQSEATHQIEEIDFQESPQCKESWCRWVLHDSMAFARRQGPQHVLATKAAPRQKVALPVLPLAEEEDVEDDGGLVFL